MFGTRIFDGKTAATAAVSNTLTPKQLSRGLRARYDRHRIIARWPLPCGDNVQRHRRAVTSGFTNGSRAATFQWDDKGLPCVSLAFGTRIVLCQS